jgi:hypothetical protein
LVRKFVNGKSGKFEDFKKAFAGCNPNQVSNLKRKYHEVDEEDDAIFGDLRAIDGDVGEKLTTKDYDKATKDLQKLLSGETAHHKRNAKATAKLPKRPAISWATALRFME